MKTLRSGFHDHVKRRITEGQQYLKANKYAIHGTDIPDVKKIEPLLQGYLGSQESPPPQHIKSAAALGPNMGTAYEALDQLDIATAWYQLGQYTWRGGKQFDSVVQEPADYGSRMTAGRLQLKSAICAERVGSIDRASDLFTWAVENKSFTEKELQGFEETKQPWLVWEWAIQRSYALLCLGEFQLAHRAAKEALHWIKKDSRAKLGSATEMPLLIFASILALINYELDPSPENRTEAIRLLDLDAVATRFHPDQFRGLFYLFNLRAKYPELAAPADEDLPPSVRAQQAAEACRRWIAKSRIQLDNSVDSLKVLDKYLKEIYREITDEEQRKLSLFMLGSYFGEVVRAELAGGKWNFSTEEMLAWTIDWDIGEVELHLWPYQRVHEYATSKTNESLTDLWEQTEQAYLDFGLAALYSE